MTDKMSCMRTGLFGFFFSLQTIRKYLGPLDDSCKRSWNVLFCPKAIVFGRKICSPKHFFPAKRYWAGWMGFRSATWSGPQEWNHGEKIYRRRWGVGGKLAYQLVNQWRRSELTYFGTRKQKALNWMSPSTSTLSHSNLTGQRLNSWHLHCSAN